MYAAENGETVVWKILENGGGTNAKNIEGKIIIIKKTIFALKSCSVKIKKKYFFLLFRHFNLKIL